VSTSYEEWFDTQAICKGTDLQSFEVRLLQIVYDKGCDSFQEFMASFTYDKETGRGLNLRDIAALLDLSVATFICYHAKWVKRKAPKRVTR